MLCDNSTLLNTMPYWYLPFADACFFYISCQKDNVAGFLLKLMFEFNLVFFWLSTHISETKKDRIFLNMSLISTLKTAMIVDCENYVGLETRTILKM